MIADSTRNKSTIAITTQRGMSAGIVQSRNPNFKKKKEVVFKKQSGRSPPIASQVPKEPTP
ncbi:hypothetical protein FBU30_002567, partial [Linnemannia zychae]